MGIGASLPEFIACQIAGVGDQQFAPHRVPFCPVAGCRWPPCRMHIASRFFKVTDIGLLRLSSAIGAS